MPHAVTTEYHPLDFHDVAQLDEKARKQAITALGPILADTFSQLDPSWSRSVRWADHELRQRLQQWRTTVFDPIMASNPAANHYFDFILAMSEYCFSNVDIEEKFIVCQINGVGVIIDDQMATDADLREETKSFLRKLFSGRPIRSRLLKELGELCAQHAELKVDPAVSDYQWTSWINYLAGANIENESKTLLEAMKLPLKYSDSKVTKVAPTSSGLPYFVRAKSGVSEAWILTIFSQNGNQAIPMDMWLPILPDVMAYTNLTNDLLSAPKEILQGEDATYFNYQTYAKRQVDTPGSGADGLWCFEDTVREACDWFVESIARVDGMTTLRYEHERSRDETSQNCKNAKFVLDSWMAYKAGLLEMHFETKRYNAKNWFPELERVRLAHREQLADTAKSV